MIILYYPFGPHCTHSTPTPLQQLPLPMSLALTLSNSFDNANKGLMTENAME